MTCKFSDFQQHCRNITLYNNNYKNKNVRVCVRDCAYEIYFLLWRNFLNECKVQWPPANATFQRNNKQYVWTYIQPNTVWICFYFNFNKVHFVCTIPFSVWVFLFSILCELWPFIHVKKFIHVVMVGIDSV